MRYIIYRRRATEEDIEWRVVAECDIDRPERQRILLGKNREIGGSSDNERYDGQDWDIRPDGEPVVHGSMH